MTSEQNVPEVQSPQGSPMSAAQQDGDDQFSAAVGAIVPPSLALGNLPDAPTLGGDSDGVLKYATVEGDVVVVDPIGMRVVDVIHRGAGP